jgi:hypothetical protein
MLTYACAAEEETADDRQDRLAKLSAFQVQICRHAMKCLFSPARSLPMTHSLLSPRSEENCLFDLYVILLFLEYTLAYKKTGSIHAEENERVVTQVLESEEARSGGFTLAPRSSVLPVWSRRGLPSEFGDDPGHLFCDPLELHT